MTESAEHTAFLPVPAAQTCCPPAHSRASDPHRIKISPRTKIHSPAALGSYKKGTLPGAFLFGKDSPFRPAGMRAHVRGKGKAWSTTRLQPSAWWEGGQFRVKRLCLITRKRLAAPRRRCEGACSRAAEASGTFAEKEEGRSGMRKARSWTGLFEWSAVHSNVG